MIPPLEPGQRLLILGIGNLGRQDDGVGVRFVERLAERGVPASVTLEANYQLVPEDALLLATHDVVLFVDATMGPETPEPYAVTPVTPASEVSFSTHALSMGSLLALCMRLYGHAPRAWCLALPAYAFEVNADPSARAAANLDRALAELAPVLSPAAC